ncbi:MAG: hypothetical protein ACJ77K_09485 [Bacteroidia bacterium]
MAESITISRTPPAFKSMQYDFLREEGLKHIEKLAGRIWTDYNLSDPGISILEVLSYVITDLGYRTNYPIKDILAQDPNLPQIDIKNFYTARQIMPMCPVTFNDYRKLLIDTDVHDPSDVGAEFVGVKNAWIEMSDENEIPVYVQKALDKLDYKPEVAGDPKVDIKCLYNVLLELSRCDKFGDLNENILEGIVVMPAIINNSPFNGLKVKVKVEFPRWDDPGIDWNDIASIRAHIKNLTLIFNKFPQGYKLEGYGLFPDKTVWMSIVQVPGGPPVVTTLMEQAIYDFIYTGANSLILLYQAKVRKILEIICAVRKRLMTNRNLCEDLFTISAIKVEEIAVCADVELAANADVEDTLAKIYFEIGKFLAPTVYFYSIEEMYEKGKRTEEIFEGPPLNHGFINDDELLSAERRKMIHVSDLIQIIMDVPGVLAVKSIQIANIPEDNDDNIPSVSVKWCLDLAFEFNYVPRLSTELSKITFFKELLPYKANEDEVDKLLQEMEDAARPQKLEGNVELDLPVPEGEFKAIEEYVSTQDEFPLVYGTGPEGLPETSSTLRKAQQKQLKGFLMFFDQLLADYLSQLAHVKDLFSMNEERDAYGNFIIDKSYFTQSLVPSVTDAESLLTDTTFYAENVQEMTEDLSLFELRRNKFLDHLMARFSEQFTDYALVEYKLTGKKAPKELLEDKLEFLNAYPEISSGRFKAFNYESPCDLWSVDNVSGLERRASLLAGVDLRTTADLNFHDGFAMTGSVPLLGFDITTPLPKYVLKNIDTYKTVEEWKLAIEELVVCGVNRDHYVIYDSSGNEIGPDNPATWGTNMDGTGSAPGNGPYTYKLFCCKDTALGRCCEQIFLAMSPSTVQPFSSSQPLKNVEKDIGNAIAYLSDEFYFNIESNRNNLSSPIEDYMEVIKAPIYPNMVPDPPTFTYDFNLYKDPFYFTTPNVKLMTGTYTGCGQAKVPEVITAIISADTVKIANDFTGKIGSGDKVSIKDSFSNDGDYTVVSLTVVGGNSEIKLSGTTPVPAFAPNVPLGSLFYNPQSVAELTAFADASIQPTLFDIMYNGTLGTHYTYDDVSGDYRFNIGDRCGDTLATSVEFDFNSDMSGYAANHPGTHIILPPGGDGKITISGNAVVLNNGTFDVVSAADLNESVFVTLSGGLFASTGGVLSFDGSFTVVSANRFTRTFVVNGILNRVLYPGETITIIDSTLNNGGYTIKNVVVNGTQSEISVEENIHDDAGVLGELYYIKQFDIFEITNSGGNAVITIKPGAEFVASNEMLEFIRMKFFGHEGMHIVEHVLLRPKVFTDLPVQMNAGVNTMQTGLVPQGKATFVKKFPVAFVNLSDNTIHLSINITSELSPMMFIALKGSTSGINDKMYQVTSVMSSGSDTVIKVLQSIPDQSLPAEGDIYFNMTLAIEPNGTTQYTIKVLGTIASEIDTASPVQISGSQDAINDHVYVIDTVSSTIGFTVFTFNQVYTHFQDDLLPINLKDDCVNCRIEDPYSFIASVVLPYWQGRFINQDFRGFFERTLRTECPAHIALNICWVNNEQMKEFEQKYKAWLVENSRKVKEPIALSAALNALIDILVRLRTVYPGGTLHDCEAEDSLANAVILNRTALGTIQI